jgi:succinyl-CoA synthetase beta subunit
MNFEEHVSKAHVLKPAGIPVLGWHLCRSEEEVASAVSKLGHCVVKAQVPTGKRGKAGGIKIVDDPDEGITAARQILGMTIGGYPVKSVLVEERAEIAREFYAAVLFDVANRSPLVLFSPEGGMEIEELARERPQSILRHVVDLKKGFGKVEAMGLLDQAEIGASAGAVAEILTKLYGVFLERDAELVEINPLALLKSGKVVALDCKFVLDDAAAYRQPDLAKSATPEMLTPLERRAAECGLKFIQLEGNVGLLANGAGLTMTTMDVIHYFGGKPANFLEIGGEAYTKSEIALDLVLSNPGVKSLVVNFCGAFARTDVMAEGVVRACQNLKPKVPVFFSIHGTGADAAVRIVEENLGVKPYAKMEDAVIAAVRVAQ